jgi:hypothetical protein
VAIFLHVTYYTLLGPYGKTGAGMNLHCWQIVTGTALIWPFNITLQASRFPNISTGVYGYPKDDAAKVAIDTVLFFLSSTPSSPEVYFVCFDDENYSIYKKILNNRDISFD